VCVKRRKSMHLFVLPVVTGHAHRDKPLDWLSADVSASIFLVMHLRGPCAAIDAPVSVTL